MSPFFLATNSTMKTSSSTLVNTTAPVVPTISTKTANTTTTIRGVVKDGHAEKAILVVNTMFREAPFLLDNSGQKIPMFTFKDYVNKQKIFGEISIIFKGEFWIYGGFTGGSGISTISKVIGCEVKEVGQIRRDNRELRFGLGRGAVRNDETIYLCFSFWTNRWCIKTNDPLGQFTDIKDKTQFYHRQTAMASSNGKWYLSLVQVGVKFTTYVVSIKMIRLFMLITNVKL